MQKYIRFFRSNGKKERPRSILRFEIVVKSKKGIIKWLEITWNIISLTRSPPPRVYLIRSRHEIRNKEANAFLAISRLRLLIRFYCTWNEQLNLEEGEGDIGAPFNRAAIFIAYPWQGPVPVVKSGFRGTLVIFFHISATSGPRSHPK